MKICILLIIGFTHYVFSCSQNISDDQYLECPFNSFGRRKRALAEYTRWHSDMQSTPEFIVKVLDEDQSTHTKPKKIVAVNIQPVTKGGEKIIIGGAVVTLPLMKSTADVDQSEVKDYTRFVLPTTVATRVEGDVFVAPVQKPSIRSEKYPPIAKARHPERDESPPASPQFLPRSAVGIARQYAPITPVSFTRRLLVPPLTPPSEPAMHRKGMPLHRTTLFQDVVLPTRTKTDMEEFGRLQAFEEDSDQQDITRTTHVAITEPERTNINIYITSTTDPYLDMIPTREKIDDYMEKKTGEKDSDIEDTMFYHYGDETNGKKMIHHMIEAYDDENRQEIQENVAARSTESEITQKRKSDKKSVVDAKGLTDISDFQEDSSEEEYDDKPSESNFSQSESTAPSITASVLSVTKNIKERLREKRRQVCSMIKLRDLNFNSPRTLPEIVAKLKQWAEKSPVAKWVDITDGNLTAMERPIYMMIVDDPSSGQVISAKQTVVIVAGIQGRDQHAVASAMYVLYELIERTESHSNLLTKFRFWVIPVLNPDGYDYAITFPQRREWTKNLRQNWDVCKGREACRSCEAFGLRCSIQPCYGVNLDRNFEYQWISAEELRMEHPCGALYAGNRQLSEPETSALVKYLHSQHRPIYLFIAFKEGEVLGVMYPYSHTRKKRAFEHVYKTRASRAAAAAYSISGRPYIAGQTSQFLPLYAGGIEDWVDSHLGVDNTYTIMMFRPADTYNTHIVTERVVHEAYAAMDTLVLQSVEKPSDVGEVAPVIIVKSDHKSSGPRPTHISLILLVSSTITLHIIMLDMINLCV